MHDRNGVPISLGDEVALMGTVVDMSGDGNFCSVNVQLVGDWDGKGGTGKNWFSAKQVLVVRKPVTEDGE